MFVGAIRTDTMLPDALGAPTAPAAALDFVAILIAAQAGGPVDSSAIKTEASRSVSVVGSLRSTVIFYTDGTSEIRTSVANDDMPEIRPAFVVNVASPVRTAAGPLSDLEPEAGIGADQARRAWRRPDRAAAGIAARARSGKGPERVSDAGAPAGSALDEMGMGRLIDRMV